MTDIKKNMEFIVVCSDMQKLTQMLIEKDLGDPE